MKKNWLLLIVLCLLTGIFVSCNKKVPKDKNVVIAIIPKVDNAIFDQVKHSAMKTAKELGIVVTWEAPTSTDGKKQIELIKNLIQYKVDGILISCNDAEILKEPINEAIKAGILVATFDSDSPKSNRIFYIGTDNKKAGKQCAETMMSLYDKAKMKPDQIIILSGGASADNMIERLSGFRSVIDPQNIADVLYSYEMLDYGEELLTYHLNNNKKINGVQMIWGLPVLSGVDSIPAMSKFVKKGGISVFFDISGPLLRYIKQNPNCATMKQDFQAMGESGIKNMYEAIKKKPFQKKILYDVKVIDHKNADEELSKL
jgi:ribose transport system substrate-binding protein